MGLPFSRPRHDFGLRRKARELFDEVGPRSDPLALSRRREVVVRVDGVELVVPMARLNIDQLSDYGGVVHGGHDGTISKPDKPTRIFVHEHSGTESIESPIPVP